MEQSDYDRLDPEERTGQFMAIGSAALGAISLCLGLVPVCGMVFGLVGLLLGYKSRHTGYRKVALVGISLSSISFLLAITYAFLLAVTK